MRFLHALIPAALLLAAAPALRADEPVRFQTVDLAMEAGTLTEMDESAAVIVARDGRRARVPLTTLTALSVARPAPPGLPALPGAGVERVFVELVDGQRLILDLQASDNPDALAGVALGLGPAIIPLDRIARVARAGADWDSPAPESDEVLLTNNDRISGFVAGIGPVVNVEGADGSLSEIASDRVREIRLANPRDLAPGLLVTDDLGVTLRARSLGVAGNGLMRLTTAAAGLGVESRGEDAVAYDRPGAHLRGLRVVRVDARAVALASLGPPAVRPTGARDWTPRPEVRPDADPIISTPDVFLPAPGEAVYDLPAGADRFACSVAALGGDWTDCTARVLAERADGTRTLLGEHRLTAATPAQRIAADLPHGARRLVLEIDPGRYGAVQDAVVFVAPRVRIAD